MKKRIVLFLALLCCALLFCSCSKAENDSYFRITFIDVGQGDSALIECDGEYMLVDAATKGSSEEVIDALSNRTEPITHLDILVASHMHDDHIGGMNEVLHYLDLHKDGNKIDLVLSNTDRGKTITATDFITQLDRMGNTLTVPAIGDIFPLGSATVEVIDNRAEKNNDSLVLLITYRDATFLFTGDMEQNQESQICDRYGDDDRWDITLLKVAHHGSKTSTSIRFLNILMPNMLSFP